MYNIVYAEDTHIDDAVNTVVEFYTSIEWSKRLATCEDSIVALCFSMIDSGILLLAYDEDNQPVGIIGGVVGSSPSNSELEVASEVFFYVKDEHRGSGLGDTLRVTFEAIAKDMGCVGVTMACVSTSSGDLGPYYVHNNYALMESIYYKEL